MDQFHAMLSSRWQQSPQSSDPCTKTIGFIGCNQCVAFVLFLSFFGRQFRVAQSWYVAEIEHFVVYSLIIFVHVCT